MPSNQKTTELTLSEGDKKMYALSGLSEAQLNFLLQHTPKEEIKTRPGRGGQVWSYVEVTYVIDMLNQVFGFKWNFKILEHTVYAEEVEVLGLLKVTFPDGSVVEKEQFGGSDIKRHAGTTWRNGSQVPNPLAGQPLSIVDDKKAAASDSLKKCASWLGIGLDLYGRERLSEDLEFSIEGVGVTPVEGEKQGKARTVRVEPTPARKTELEDLFGGEDVPTPQPLPTLDLPPEAYDYPKWEVFKTYAQKKMRAVGVSQPIERGLISALFIEGKENHWLSAEDWLHDLSVKVRSFKGNDDAKAYLETVQERGKVQAATSQEKDYPGNAYSE